MHKYETILKAIARQTLLSLPEPDEHYRQQALYRHYQIAGMIELAQHLELPDLFIAALEEHRDYLKPPRDVDSDRDRSS